MQTRSLELRPTRPAAVAGLFYPGDAARARADASRSCSASAPRAGRRPCPRRSSRRTRATSIPGRSRRASTRCSRRRARRSSASCCSGRPIASRCAGSRCPAARAFATPLGAVEIDAEAVEQLRGAAAGRRERRGARARALARSARAVSADRARRLQARAARGRACRAREDVAEVLDAAVGRPGNADRRELRSLALPRLPATRRRSTARPCEAILELADRHRPRAGVRRDAGHRPRARRAPAEASSPSCSTSGTRATPPATRAASWATASFAFYETRMTATHDAGRRSCCRSRRAAIARELGRAARARAEDAAGCASPGASFVTLKQDEQSARLHRHAAAAPAAARGREGERASAPRSAIRASSRSSRDGARRTTRRSLAALAARSRCRSPTSSDALAQLRPGIDGVVFEYGHHRSTFLPQVWEELPRARRVPRAPQAQSRAAARFLGPRGEARALHGVQVEREGDRSA